MIGSGNAANLSTLYLHHLQMALFHRKKPDATKNS